MMMAMLAWLGGALSDGQSARPSVKRLSYFFIVCGLLSLICSALTGALVMLAWQAPRAEVVSMAHIVAGLIETVMMTAVSAVTGGYLGGKAIERRPPVKPDTPPQPPKDEPAA